MNRTDKQELARRLEAIMSDLRYATDLEVPDFETMADELYDMGATINEYVDNILQGASEDRNRKLKGKGLTPYCPKCEKKLYSETYDPDLPVCPTCHTDLKNAEWK